MNPDFGIVSTGAECPETQLWPLRVSYRGDSWEQMVCSLDMHHQTSGALGFTWLLTAELCRGHVAVYTNAQSNILLGNGSQSNEAESIS